MYKSNIFLYPIICVLVLFLGLIISYCLSDNNYTIQPYDISGIIHFDVSVLLKIFLKNIFVGFSIAACGFITGGLASMLILFWNGMLVGIILKTYNIQNEILPYFIYHGIFEITAFVCLGIVGLNGIDFYVNLFKYNFLKIPVKFFEKLFIFALISLSIAAIIETLLISTLK